MKVEALKWTMAQIAEATGECLPTIHDAINVGHLDTFVIGRRRFARPEAVHRWIDFLEAESKAGRPVSYRARSVENRPRAVA